MPPTILAYFDVSAIPVPPIPLPLYVLCNFVGLTSLDIAFNIISLVYGTKILVLYPETETHSDHPPDLLAFSLIVFLVVRSNVEKVPIPSLLRTIARDATHYFLVIFTSHFVLVMFIAFASVSIFSQCSAFSLRLAQTFIA